MRKMKLVIDRDTWLRGGRSVLRNSDGQRCCLGFYLEALGAKERDTCQVADPIDLYNVLLREGRAEERKARWLLKRKRKADCDYDADAIFDNSSEAEDLMNVNDTEMPEATRERLITNIFAMHDVEVEFK